MHALGAAEKNFDSVVPRLSEVKPYVLSALRAGRRAGVRCMTEAIPLCFLPGMEEYAAEAVIPRTKIYDAGFVVEDYTEFRLADPKSVCWRRGRQLLKPAAGSVPAAVVALLKPSREPRRSQTLP